MNKKAKKATKPAKKAPAKKVVATKVTGDSRRKQRGRGAPGAAPKKTVKKTVVKVAKKVEAKPVSSGLSFLDTIDRDLKSAKPAKKESFLDRVGLKGSGNSFLDNLSSRH